MTENRSHTNIWPFVLGFLAGAVLGVLLAPEKGEVTRKKLKRKTDELKGKIGSTIDDARERVTPVMEKIQQKVEPVISGIKKLEQFEEDVKEELADTFDEEDGLPLDTSLSGHKLELPKEEGHEPIPNRQVPPKPKRKSLFKNLK